MRDMRAREVSDAEAVWMAMRQAAVRDEVRALAADSRDREEMRVIREQLAELAPQRKD